MARLLTAGAETLNAIGDNKTMEGSITTTGTVTVDTGTVNTGSKSFKCDSDVGNATAYVQGAFTGALAVTYYAKAWINTTASLAANRSIIQFLTGGAATILGATLQTNGTVTISTLSSGVVNDGAWHCIELSVLVNSGAGADDSAELKVDGVVVQTLAAVTLGTTEPGQVKFGWNVAPGASKVVFYDDLAVNDSQGANQNTYPGLGKQVLLLPTADSAGGTGWVLGTGTALGGNGFAAVDNIPPVGVADLAAGSDPKQIRNATAAANSNYDATMTTYAAASIAAADTVNLVQPWTITAAPVSTSAKQGTVGVASNPAITNVALAAGGVSGAFWSGTAGGTYPTGWKHSPGTLTYAPSVTVGTAPVMRVTQVTSSTRIAVVCFMGMYVDYTPAAAAQVPYVNPMPPLIAQ